MAEEKTNNKKVKHSFLQLSFNNGAEVLIFPVLPEEILVKKKGKGQTYDIVGLGEVNVIKSRELAEVSFESFFPADKNAPYLSVPITQFNDPETCVKKINGWQESIYPCRLLVQTENLKFTIAVSIESFERWEAAGHGGDIYFSLTLKEYKFYSVRRLVTEEDEKTGKTKVKQEPAKRPDERVPPDTYVLKQNDNLWKVAQLQLGDGSRWKELMKLNNLTEAQVKKLQVGMVLKLPKRK
ncbi:LysM peptidoglycan-binding domain-containing protein [Paenibacillus sp. GCM10012307]|uniref:LysM peptidoglycan-binding domain-containing protein n=1 Tax=Paenibacillus roseus TaxID=2798579 RepID=A0A934MKC1_9BACL|nr:LysM domain-containing protein [Paenibacillus roseus]MBJ6360880.1 LysM peptidoglycan-binding domain-containing protein [Paenibacillus roseus]